MLKKIEGYDNYFVNEEGDVFSNKCGSMKRLKTIKMQGYYYVGLSKKGRVKMFRLHRLVANTFLPNPENKPCIDHINGDRADNRAENLRWVTHKENSNNPITMERNRISKKGHVVTEETRRKMAESMSKKNVAQYTTEGGFVSKYISMREAEKMTGVRHSDISMCCNGKRKTAGGYIWRFAS